MKDNKNNKNLKIILAVFTASFLLIGGILFMTMHRHEYTAQLTEPTCTEQGYTTFTCACGKSYVSDIVEKRGHLGGEWEIVTSATDITNGLKVQKCSSCGEKVAEEILIASPDLNFISNGDGTCFVDDISSCKDPIVVIPSAYNGMRVINIRGHAFNNSVDLTNVMIPDSVTSIGDYAFIDCNSLTSITVDPNNPIYASVNGVLFNKELTSLIRYPNGKAGAYTVPSTVTIIEDGAFEGCIGLTSVAIPDTVTRIGKNAFSRCNSLTSVTVDSHNPNYVSVDGVLFNKAITELVYYPTGRTGAYTIPNTVTFIGNFSFIACDGLTGITIPDSVTIIGDYAFRDCGGLTSIAVPVGMKSIGRSAFEHCRNLTSISFNGTVSEWYAISKGYNWNFQTPAEYAVCTDGNHYLR